MESAVGVDTTAPTNDAPAATSTGPMDENAANDEPLPVTEQDPQDDPVRTANTTPSRRTAPYTVRMGDAWTVHDGTYDPIPLDKRRKRDVPFPTHINLTFEAMHALSSLQLSYNAPIPMTAIDIASEHLWKCMPSGARQYLRVLPPNGPALWGACDQAPKKMYERMEHPDLKYLVHPGHAGFDEVEYRGYGDLKRQPWVIWPLWVEDQWGKDYVTVIWYSSKNRDFRRYFDSVEGYAIIDPRRSPEAGANGRHEMLHDRTERIKTRLFEHWTRAGMKCDKAQWMDVRCSPMPSEEATSGERCWAVIKALVDQIMTWFITARPFCPKTTITSMSQWVNPFQQRVELAGINAWILMASMDYDARIAVEAIRPETRTIVAADGKRKELCNYDLAGPSGPDQPHVASFDYLLPYDGLWTPPQDPLENAGDAPAAPGGDA